MNTEFLNNRWGMEFDNRSFVVLIYLPFIFTVAYIVKMVGLLLWSLLTPGSQWIEFYIILGVAIVIGTLFCIGNWLLDSMEKSLKKIQRERVEMLNKIETLELQNAEMRHIFRRVMVFSDSDKQVFLS